MSHAMVDLILTLTKTELGNSNDCGYQRTDRVYVQAMSEKLESMIRQGFKIQDAEVSTYQNNMNYWTLGGGTTSSNG